uniref:Uncharacterized protein n=1 Tax=Mycena chlorophos TaxID=658473 RepID=A0ABQ0LDM9_MYCCL|nr:predicted protein [Mycena chlorophos]
MGMLVFKTQILTQMVQVVKNENQLRFSSSCGTDCSVRTHWAFRVGVFTGPGTGPAGSFCSNIPSQRQSSESLVVIQRSGGENAGTTLLAKVSGLLRYRGKLGPGENFLNVQVGCFRTELCIPFVWLSTGYERAS